MKKHITILTFATIILFTACGTNAVNGPNVTGQAASLTQDGQANKQEAHSVPSTFATQAQAEQTDTLSRIYERDYWIAGIVSRWSAELGMTVDEIFDYVRAATRLEYAFDHGIEGGMDVSELAARVEESSVSFMSIIHMAYNVTRSVDVAHRWAAELDMTVHELGDYVFGGNNSRHLADALGVEWGEFQTVLAGVGNALWYDRVRMYTNAESVDIASGWANELGMELDEFVDYYNGFNFNFASTIEALEVGHMYFSLVMAGAMAYSSLYE